MFCFWMKRRQNRTNLRLPRLCEVTQPHDRAAANTRHRLVCGCFVRVALCSSCGRLNQNSSQLSAWKFERPYLFVSGGRPRTGTTRASCVRFALLLSAKSKLCMAAKQIPVDKSSRRQYISPHNPVVGLLLTKHIWARNARNQIRRIGGAVFSRDILRLERLFISYETL